MGRARKHYARASYSIGEICRHTKAHKTSKGIRDGCPNFIVCNGEPWWARTRHPFIKCKLKHSSAGYGSYNLFQEWCRGWEWNLTGLLPTDFKSRETGITWSYETIRVSMNWIGIVLWCPVR